MVLEKKADDPNLAGVRVANMHRVKDLEFPHMFMASVNEGVIPDEAALRGTQDETEQRETERAERALMHVCATRATASLMVSWHGTPSAFVGQA